MICRLSIRTINACLAAVFALLLAMGCTTAGKTGDQTWIDLFGPDPSTELTAGCADYSAARLDSDYRALASLIDELESLANETAAMKRMLVYKDNAYWSEAENARLELLLLRYANARDALWEMVEFCRLCRSSDPETHTKGAVLGMNAGLNLAYHISRFVALFSHDKDVIKRINMAHPRYQIPVGFYDTLYDSATSVEHLELLDVGWYLFCQDLADPASELSKLRDSDPVYRDLIARMDGLHADTHIQTEYVLYAKKNPMTDLRNRLHHSRIAELGEEVNRNVAAGMYRSRGVIFRDVARIKKPGSHILQFSDAQVEEIKSLLELGDVLLTYSSGYMSNVFLPGTFKHGITYIGTVEDRRNAGLTDDLLESISVSDAQAAELIELANASETPDGYQINIIEAVAEGVIMNSLDKLLETHINRLVVIRPNVSAQEQVDQLVALMQYVGTAYDFKFDFQDDTYQCCTELIYRTINRKGTIDFGLAKTRGLWVLSADDILRYSLEPNPAAFEFVLLADGSPDKKDRRAVIRTGDEGLRALHTLMRVEPLRG